MKAASAAHAPQTVFIALGANLGDASATVRQALEDLETLPDTQVLKASSLYRSAPVEASGPDFVNAVAQLSTRLAPLDLLAALQRLERAAGRERAWRNAPRTLDLDILLYGDIEIDSPALSLPHPRMNARAFVLLPLAEIAPERVSAADLQAVQDQAITRLN